LFRLSPGTSRNLALSPMGWLSRMPGGRLLIEFMGHMRPDARLAREVMGIKFPTAVGLGVGIDERMLATEAWARFGFGFLEVGAIGPSADSETSRPTLAEEIGLDAD